MYENRSEESFILLSLGSNLGDRIGTINKAISLLRDSGSISELSLSSFYETAPYGYREQPWFINIALIAKSKVTPLDLLKICKDIENKIGRLPRAKWHEREIDIDLILYGDEIIDNEYLKIPHPAMQERLFVLVPSAELAGERIHPKFCLSIKELLVKCTDKSEIRIIE